MKILVPVKRVVDHNVKVRVRPDGTGVELANLKMSINPFDEIAVEEALRLKEAGLAVEVVAVSVGTKASEDVLRKAMGMGADRAILVQLPEGSDAPEPLSVAKLLKSVVLSEGARLVIAGKQAIDDDMNATGQMLAALLGWGQGTFASAVAVDGDVATITREVDGGLQTVALPLPAVVTADLRLNEPRFTSLPNMMKAKKKPIEAVDAATLGVDLTPRLSVLETREPAARAAGEIVASVDELVAKLKAAGVI
ncbi:electron transfer flavoprotein subunit beta/FixA family protein [Ketogulonicigenium vulgare]|uniref:electron transfer flavoprotein subunit beta/FixA family protein n=1 Tax=Ketogulonicigenium vulgare TaxID=92945 RepID=UPI002358CDE8|nr:electron transfer flavoprotein subunit beta/FixA family protein [Ketogulonicigenium vulgare]